MQRIWIGLLVAALGVAQAACLSAVDEPCKANVDCVRGKVCFNSVCVKSNECTPESCGPGTFCGLDMSCVTVESTCADSAMGCECHIANGAGEFVARDHHPGEGLSALDASEIPVITLSPGAEHATLISTALVGSSTIPGAAYSYTLNDESSFAVDENGVVTATATPGTATLTATMLTSESNDVVTCTATLVNVGPNQVSNSVRVRVFDDATGLPIQNAKVVLDTNHDGIDDGYPNVDYGTTDADGLLTSTALSSGNVYDITVFHSKYHFVTFVGLSTTTDIELSIPMTQVLLPKADRKVAGFSAMIDSDIMTRTLIPNNKDPFLSLALVAGSFPLRSLISFDLGMLMGDKLPEGDCAILETGMPTLQPCLPLPQTVFGRTNGAYMTNQAGQLRGAYTDIEVRPGRRYAWSLGLGLDIDRITDYVADYNQVLPKSLGFGEAESFDADAVNFAQVMKDLAELMPFTGLGTSGNVNAPSKAYADWKARKAEPYFDDSQSSPKRTLNNDFPVLDSKLYDVSSATQTWESGDMASSVRASLGIIDALNKFTTVTVPELPENYDAIAILTGVDSQGYGFVPMGLGLGLDCLGTGCVTGTAPAGFTDDKGSFDGHITGSEVCTGLYACPEGAPFNARLGTDQVGVFSASARDALVADERVTVVAALPVSSLITKKPGVTPPSYSFDLNKLQVRAAVLHGDNAKLPAGEAKDLSAVQFAKVPQADLEVDNRMYEIKRVEGLDAHWIVANTLENDDDARPSVKWNIFASPDDNVSFTAPAVPEGMRDPFAHDPQTGKLNVTHLGFDLDESTTLRALIANGGGKFVNILRHAVGFSGGVSEVKAKLGSNPN